MENIKELNEIISSIKKANKSFAYSVWLPSLKKEVLFKEINTSQQKALLKSMINSPISNSEFIYALKQIIQENCVDDKININQLTILDKLFIAIMMRSVSIGNTLEFEIKTEEGKVRRGIGLKEFLDKVKDNINVPDPKRIDYENFHVMCSVPTIEREYRLEDELRKNMDVKTKSKDELKELLGEIYLAEIVKYVDTIGIKDGDEITQIQMDDLSFKDRIAIYEQLPINITKEIQIYVKDLQTEINKVLITKIETKDGEKEVRLNINANFFIGS